MNLRRLEISLKFVIAGIGILLLAILVWLLPIMLWGLLSVYGDMAKVFVIWTLCLLLASIPCFIVLYHAWNIVTRIGQNQVFTYETASYFKKIYNLTVFDLIFFLLVNIILFFLNMNHMGVMLVSLMIIFFALAVAICAKTLYYLVNNAAQIKEENDLTI